MDDDEYSFRKRVLAQQVSASSEEVSLEYRRRQDQFYATLHVARGFIISANDTLVALKKSSASKLRRGFLGVLLGSGLLLQWLLPPTGNFNLNVGTYLLAVAAIVYLSHLYGQRQCTKQLAHLNDQEALLLVHWLASGASRRDYERMRDFMIREHQSRGKRSSSTEAENEKLRLAILLEISEDQFERASGRSLTTERFKARLGWRNEAAISD